jgi:hypothetical protein
VRNPIARQAIKAAGRALPEARLTHVRWRLKHKEPQSLTRYRLKIRHQLATSNLALLIPGGLSMLPDLYSSLPAVWRPLAVLFKPRNLSQLIQHIACYLDWYVSPGSNISVRLVVNPALVAAILYGAGTVITLLTSSSSIGWIFLITAVLLGISIVLAIRGGELALPGLQIIADSERHAVRCRELFEYLGAAYSDED